MKLHISKIVGFAYLFTNINATFDTMLESLEVLIKNNTDVAERLLQDFGDDSPKRTVRSIASPSGNGPQMRVFNFMVASLLTNIDGYGCWCYFNDAVGQGKSKPVDQVDELCRMLQFGYECVTFDNGEDCSPHSVFYNDAVMFGLDDIEARCNSMNAALGQCAIDSCVVEGSFVKNYFDLLSLSADIDPDNKHSNNFDISANCPTQSGAVSERKCCGTLPNRFPYRTLNDQRKCCGSTTYDSDINQCCEEAGDLVIRFICGL